jgi:TonB family protein
MTNESEIRKSWDRERAYHKRLLRIVPVALVIVLILFVTSDQVSVRELEKHVGFKGAMQLLPEISIIPDDNPFTSDLVEEELPEEPDFPELLFDDFEVATRKSHSDVPYSETYIILKMVQPEYPFYELENGIEGSVTVELFVNEDGIVEMASILSSIGPKSFGESSLKAVRQFVFQPPMRGDEPTSMWIKFLIKFRIYQ